MYENYTHQALPTKKYRELLGSALCVFVSNNLFIIENILRCDDSYSWYELIDKQSGKLLQDIKNTITKNSDKKIAELFNNIVNKRNRIIHSFQCTVEDEQMLMTKDKNNKQYVINERFLLDFIRENDKLSNLLHDFRGY